MSKDYRIEKTKIINNVLHAKFDDDSLEVTINLPEWDEDEYENEDEYWDKIESEITHYEYSIMGCIDLSLEEDGDYTRGHGDDDFISFEIEGDYDWRNGHRGDFEISIDEDGNYGIFTGKQMAQIVWDVIHDQIPNISKQMLEEELGNPPMGTRDFTKVVGDMLNGARKEIFKTTEKQWDNR